MECKTPVSLLQEYFAKRQSLPTFSLISDQGVPHLPTFVYHVSGLGMSASGSGSSKKEAKHAAAEALLIKLQEGMNYDSILFNPYEDALKSNAIGALQEFCLTYMISIPRYDDIMDNEDVRIPQLKVFTVKCFIPPLTTIGEGRSKKQAKQVAAYLMLVELKKLLEKNSLINVSRPCETKDKQSRAVDKLCVQLERELKIPKDKPRRVAIEKMFVDVFVSEDFKRSERWKHLLECENVDQLANPIEFFKQLMRELSIVWEVHELKNLKKKSFIGLELKHFWDATFFGEGLTKEEAFQNAVVSALSWFYVMSE